MNVNIGFNRLSRLVIAGCVIGAAAGMWPASVQAADRDHYRDRNHRSETRREEEQRRLERKREEARREREREEAMRRRWQRERWKHQYA